MTMNSVMDAVKTLLISNAGIGTARRADEAIPAFDADKAPWAILAVSEQPPPVERRLGAGKGGYKERTWWLDTTIWAYYPDPEASATDFRDLLESVYQALNAPYPDLGGTANTPTTKVLIFGDQFKGPSALPWQEDNGMVARPGLLSTMVREIVAG